MRKWYIARPVVQRRLIWIFVLSLLLVLSAGTARFFIPSAQVYGRAQQPETVSANVRASSSSTVTPSSLPRFDHIVIVTFDEGEETSLTNQIATLFVGQHVQVGSTDAANINHYNVLRTLEDMYGLTPANNAASAADITGIWN